MYIGMKGSNILLVGDVFFFDLICIPIHFQGLSFSSFFVISIIFWVYRFVLLD